ncbi:uncharacterized protein LOC112892568 [Panicum hallii]|uniref:uncharacterized protein LOC112892568 n=1 Tax=Panicum hallii TaxID=206008 RepID=UPI000DF4D63E|nr:uncharacterized protein LOC112892568 [Panicum hallii]
MEMKFLTCTRGWGDIDFHNMDSQCESATETLHTIMRGSKELIELLGPAMNKLSMITSAGVKETYSVLHAGYVPVAERRVFAKDGQGGIKIEGSSSREQAFTAMLPQAPAKRGKEALNQSRKRLLYSGRNVMLYTDGSTKARWCGGNDKGMGST